MAASLDNCSAVSLRIDRSDIRTSSRGSGRSFVYVLPCRDADLVKIGYSRSPLQRFETLHPRWFDYFDLDGGALVEFERVGDARRTERDFLVRFAAQRAIAPYVVPKAAAGHTEWHAGVQEAALERARAVCAEGGLALHAPLRGWLRAELGSRLDRQSRPFDSDRSSSAIRRRCAMGRSHALARGRWALAGCSRRQRARRAAQQPGLARARSAGRLSRGTRSVYSLAGEA